MSCWVPVLQRHEFLVIQMLVTIASTFVGNGYNYAKVLTEIVFLKLRFFSIQKDRFVKGKAALGYR